MPKFESKTQLLAESQKEYQALEKLLAPLTPEQMTQPGMLGEWSVKDVLAHLYEWQQMMLGWYQAGLRGETPEVPGRGYKWNQLAELNQEIYATYQGAPLDDVRAKFRASHQQMIDLIESLPENDLLAPGCFSWTGKHNLATFIDANTGSHYRWASTGLRKQIKALVKAT